MKEKSFFVNLGAESSEALAYKVGLIVKELQGRTEKQRSSMNTKHDRSIDKPVKRKLSKEEVEKKIYRWAQNKDLKISKCLTLMKQNKWSVTKTQWKKMMSQYLLIRNPELFLVSLTKEPFERSWVNSKGEQKKASDYGAVLRVRDNKVELNPEYQNTIKLYW